MYTSKNYKKSKLKVRRRKKLINIKEEVNEMTRK
jgi:hypothetical protein